MSVNNFDILKTMASRNLDIRMSPLDNISNMKVTHKGQDTDVTIGVRGNVILQIMNGRLIGGLLLYDKKQYFEIKTELEHTQDQTNSDKGEQG